MYVHLAVPDEKVLFNSVKILGVCKLKILSMSFFYFSGCWLELPKRTLVSAELSEAEPSTSAVQIRLGNVISFNLIKKVSDSSF